MMMFGLFPKLYALGALALALAVGFGWFVHSIRKDARQEVITTIERNEDDARRKAVEGARNVDSCWDAGGMWHRSTGTCRLP